MSDGRLISRSSPTVPDSRTSERGFEWPRLWLHTHIRTGFLIYANVGPTYSEILTSRRRRHDFTDMCTNPCIMVQMQHYSYILSNTSSSNFPSNSSIYTYTFNYDFLIKLARKPSTQVKSRRYDDYEDPIWEKPSRRNTWLSLNSFSTTLVLGSPTQDQQGNQIYPYRTSIVPWSRLDHPNHFVVRSRFYRNSAGTTHQRWTSTQPASLVIGSTEPLPSFAMPTYYVECATYKYSKPLMPRLQSTPLSNLMQNWGWDMSLLKSSSMRTRRFGMLLHNFIPKARGHLKNA